jgi:hypothetical protein
MADNQKSRGAIKLVFWAALALGLIGYAWWSYTSGQMVEWYYFRAKTDGFAVNANTFRDATKEKPMALEIGTFNPIVGLQAVAVKKGDRLPTNTNGVISKKELEEGKRVKLDGDKIVVMVPIQVKEARGFKFKDSYKHKGIETNPWSGPWNVAWVLALGVCLGYSAEGLTDVFGLKLTKIQHHGH